MKRWAVCRIVDDPDGGGTIPAVGKYPANWWILNSPVKSWVLTRFSAASLAAIEADADIYILPDATLDASWGSMPANVRNAVINKLGQIGYETTAIKTSWTVRQVIEYLGQQAVAGFSTTAQDVADLP